MTLRTVAGDRCHTRGVATATAKYHSLMPGSLHELLSRDHARLDALLAGALSDDGTIEQEKYAEFRRGLLRHIGIEERILFPEIRKRLGSSEMEQQLHRDHAALAALLVPPPTGAEIEQIRGILIEHNPLEEGAGGLYEQVEQLSSHELEKFISAVRSFPEIPPAPYTDSPLLRRSIEQLVREAEDGRRLLRDR
jgi:Hemerythrin HHE cation binding domain